MQLTDCVMLMTTVPETHADLVRDAIGRAGAGKIGDYSYCSFSVTGVGRFMPDTKANPFIGTSGVLEKVIEERIEVPCSRSILKEVIEALRKAHPYEQPMIVVLPCMPLDM